MNLEEIYRLMNEPPPTLASMECENGDHHLPDDEMFPVGIHTWRCWKCGESVTFVLPHPGVDR